MTPTLVLVMMCVFCSTCQADPQKMHRKPQTRTRVIQTKYGMVQGFVTRVGRDAEEQRHVQVFLGIPYAAPPVGDHRFAPTRAPAYWSGIKTAFEHSPVCIQAFPNITNMTRSLEQMPMSRLKYLQSIKPALENESEDCLYLNIYVPIEARGNERSSQFPVMIFVHGEESYSWGSGNLFDGRVLASYGKVILITFNYRLGVLGFLNTNVNPDRHPSMANYGLMDQVALLNWVQDNIASFGGNPKSVTLFGYQSGAALIQLLMKSPAVIPDLFHRAILMSGSSLSTWATVEDPVHYAVKIATHFNCTIPRNMISDHATLLHCLRNRPARQLADFPLNTPSFLCSMGPAPDGILVLGEKQQQANMAQRGYQVIVGLVEDETDLYFANDQVEMGINPITRDKFFRTLIRNSYNFHRNEIFFAVQNEYSSLTFEDTRMQPQVLQWDASRALTDKLYLAPALKTAEWSQKLGFPTYFYVFKFAREESTSNKFVKRSRRGSMLPLVFGVPFAPELALEPQWLHLGQISGAEAGVAQQLLTLWSNFAWTGDPRKPNAISAVFPRQQQMGTTYQVGNIVWEPFQRNKQKYLDIDLTSAMNSHFRSHSVALWLRLVPELHSSGADSLFPEHNLFEQHDNPNFFTGIVRPNSFSHGYQLNRKLYASPTSQPLPAATTCLPVNSRGQLILGKSNENKIQSDDQSFVTWDSPKDYYKNALYMTMALGTILLVINIWFVLCIFCCRNRVSRCLGLQSQRNLNNTSGIAGNVKECDTELERISNDSFHTFNVREGGHYRSRSSSRDEGSLKRCGHRRVPSSSSLDGSRAPLTSSPRSMASNSRQITLQYPSHSSMMSTSSTLPSQRPARMWVNTGSDLDNTSSIKTAHQQPHAVTGCQTNGTTRPIIHLAENRHHHHHQTVASPNASSTASSQGISIILPPPPSSSSSTSSSSVLKNKNESTWPSKGQKMKTFGQSGQEERSTVSFGGETILH